MVMDIRPAGDALVYPPIPPLLKFAIEAEELGISLAERISQFEKEREQDGDLQRPPSG
jgi:hypothetical protein